jgi:hypothetical protein
LVTRRGYLNRLVRNSKIVRPMSVTALFGTSSRACATALRKSRTLYGTTGEVSVLTAARAPVSVGKGGIGSSDGRRTEPIDDASVPKTMRRKPAAKAKFFQKSQNSARALPLLELQKSPGRQNCFQTKAVTAQ